MRSLFSYKTYEDVWAVADMRNHCPRVLRGEKPPFFWQALHKSWGWHLVQRAAKQAPWHRYGKPKFGKVRYA